MTVLGTRHLMSKIDDRFCKCDLLSNDHYLVVNWIRWQGRLPDKSYEIKTHSEGELELSDEALVLCGFRLTPSGEFFTCPGGDWVHVIRMDHVQGLWCRCGFQKMWPEGHWFLLEWQPKEPLQKQKVRQWKNVGRPWRRPFGWTRKFCQTFQRLRKGKQTLSQSVLGKLLNRTEEVVEQ